MSWASAIRKPKNVVSRPIATIEPGQNARFELAKVDWTRLVSLDFETYYDDDYTLSKLSTSEYIRDPRFKAQMVGIKIGKGKTKIYAAAKVRAALKAIDWKTHSLLAHNAAFDGFILNHHYGITPKQYYDTLSMARGLHSNEIGAGLDEVSMFYGGQGKIKDTLETTRGVLNWPIALNKSAGIYCANDVDEMYRIFKEMIQVYPTDEIDLIHITCRMFCNPTLRVDVPRVQAEYEREIARRKELMLNAITDPRKYDYKNAAGKWVSVLDKKAGRDELTGDDRDMAVAKKVLGSNEKFVALLVDAGVPEDMIPRKISKAWMKLKGEEREANLDKKWSYAFAKDDLDFVDLPERVWELHPDWNPNKTKDILKAVAMSERLRDLVSARLITKSTTNITRAERFLKASENGMCLPVGYNYAAAHTFRWGGANKMNMQNLTRGGELRLSILAAAKRALAVCDSGQIEARVNAWLWGQTDLLEAFRKSDAYDREVAALPKEQRREMREDERDAYCRFADNVYGRTIWKADKDERFLGKACVAAGELVLTDHGLVPIEGVTLEHRLWDGVEWVSHAGLIDQGIKDVITYDGLTATPDHQVFTEDGRVVPLGQAASEMARLQRTGAGRTNLRFCDSAVIADTPRKRLSVRQGQMRPDWYYEADVFEQLEKQEDVVFSEEWAQASTARISAGAAIRRNFGEVHQNNQSGVGGLWRSWDSDEVQQPDGVHSVGERELTPQRLHRGGDRQDRQQRPLRAGEFAIGHTNGAEPEQAQHANDPLARTASPAPRVPEPLQQELDVSALSQRTDGRTDLRKVRVYDIADAGPRRRFTASGKLVFNCVLGLGFQMGVDKFQMTLAKGALGGPRVNFTRDHCGFIVNTYRTLNYKIVEGWKKCASIIEDMAAGVSGAHSCISWGGDGEGNGWILLPNGMHLKYPDLRQTRNEERGYMEWSYQSKEMRKKIYGGLLCENLVQALARIIVATQMLWIDKKYPCVMTTHDEVVAHPTLATAEKCYQYMYKCMTTPLWWCPDMPLAAEGGWDLNYSK